MKDSIDTRDTGPRAGSPLWTYLAAGTAAGMIAFAIVLTGGGEIGALLLEPLFWVMAVLVLIGELRPVNTPGSQTAGSATASTMFAFAVLLFYGPPTAVMLHAAAVLITGIVTRKAWFRIAFNVAQYSLAFVAAAVTLAAFGIQAHPGAPAVPSGADLLPVVLAGAAYFVVTDLLVCGAVALHERRSWLRVVWSTLGYQSIAHAALLGMAPLITVVMAHTPALVPLSVAPLMAVYFTATLSMRRDHQAMHDSLTGLPNRKMLMLRTEEALEDADQKAGLLMLDLNRFKEVNDTLGHMVGDRLLQMVAHRLTHSVRPGDVVARLGGDEFAVLLPAIRDERAAREVAARLRVALGEPVRLEGMTFDLDASIGIAVYPDHAPDFGLLLQRADVAMYAAKQNGGGVEAYTPAKDRNSPARLGLLSDLRRGIDRGELSLCFQPKVFMRTGMAAGMEALVRWSHPKRGPVAAAEFVSLAEQSYLMSALTKYVVNEALRQAARWWESGLPVPVSVNVSARDLLDTGLPDVIAEALKSHDLPPDALQLEVTERVLMTDQAYTAGTVQALAELGVPLALDDFGTGYSSLVRLHRLPVQEVKIDSSFFRRITRSAEDSLIVRSIVDLVGSLGMRSVAEGIEDSAAASAVRKMGCEAAQGWWISEALPADEAAAWLGRNLQEAGQGLAPH